VKKIKLYELSQNYLKVQDMLDNADIDTDMGMIKDTFESIETALEEKAQSISVIASKMTADINYVNSEIKRLQAIKKTTESRLEWLKGYMLSQFETIGMDKLKTPTFTISVKQNPPSLVIDDEKLIPAKYLTVVPRSFKPNNADIKDALKSGRKVKGCRLESKKRIDIR
jgi:hypothetical protein